MSLKVEPNYNEEKASINNDIKEDIIEPILDPKNERLP